LFQRAVALDPHHAEALLDLAGALAKSGRAAEAVPYFESAIEAGGPTTVALNGLGFARLEAGDAAGGMAVLRRSLALEPRQPQVAAALDQLARGRRP
jgi:Tfp pilus assembly protein PilF